MKKSLLIIALLSGCNFDQSSMSSTSSEKESSPLLTKYIVGKPYMAYFDAEKVVALRWGINLKHIFAGSKSRKEIESKRSEVEASNIEAYRFYDKKFGVGWQLKFNKEVEAQKNRER